jgi:hypothetical protein
MRFLRGVGETAQGRPAVSATVGYDRQCRSCLKWTAFAGKLSKAQTCEFCRKPFGALVLGMDVPREKVKVSGSIPKGQQRAPVASDFKPGDYGYVSPIRRDDVRD